MGSHIIDLVQYLIDDKTLYVKDSKVQSKISDIDDIVEATLTSQTGVDISLYFNWVNKNVRKPVFSIEIETKDGFKYVIDQQQINKYRADKFIEKVSVINLAKTVPYYLRGVDFTDQMIDLTNDNRIMATVEDALNVNKTIAKILN